MTVTEQLTLSETTAFDTSELGFLVVETPEEELTRDLVALLGETWACCVLDEQDPQAAVVVLTPRSAGDLAQLVDTIRRWAVGCNVEEVFVTLHGTAAISSDEMKERGAVA